MISYPDDTNFFLILDTRFQDLSPFLRDVRTASIPSLKTLWVKSQVTSSFFILLPIKSLFIFYKLSAEAGLGLLGLQFYYETENFNEIQVAI